MATRPGSQAVEQNREEYVKTPLGGRNARDDARRSFALPDLEVRKIKSAIRTRAFDFSSFGLPGPTPDRSRKLAKSPTKEEAFRIPQFFLIV